MSISQTPKYVWSQDVYDRTWQNAKFEAIAEQVAKQLRAGFALKPCSILVSAQVCLIDGIQYSSELPAELFEYSPVRNLGGRMVVSTPAVPVDDILGANLTDSTGLWLTVQSAYPHLTTEESDAAITYYFDQKIEEMQQAVDEMLAAENSKDQDESPPELCPAKEYPTFRVGDQVSYLYDFPTPLAPLVGKIKAEVIEILDVDRIQIRIHNTGFARQIYIEAARKELQLMNHFSTAEELTARERKRFEAAQKCYPAELPLDTLLFDPDSEEYYELDETLELWEERGEDLEPDEPPSHLPAYLYICDRVPLRLPSAARLVKDMLVEVNSSYGVDDFLGLHRLEKAINDFNQDNDGMRSVVLNWKKVVLFPENFAARDAGGLWYPNLQPDQYPDELWESGEFGQMDLAFTPHMFKIQVQESIRAGFDVDFYPESTEWILRDAEQGIYSNHFKGLARATWSELYQCYEMETL